MGEDMEAWVKSIGLAPIATIIVALCCVIIFMARHIIKQSDERIEDQRVFRSEITALTVATNSALSSASQGMAAAAVSMNAARETMHIASAVMQQKGDRG